MSEWFEDAHSCRSAQAGAVRPLTPGQSTALRKPAPHSGVHLLRTRCSSVLRYAAAVLRYAGAGLRDAFAQARREDKVALVGVALVLIVLSWP